MKVEQQLRRLAVGRGSQVTPIVQDWITEKLGEARMSDGGYAA